MEHSIIRGFKEKLLPNGTEENSAVYLTLANILSQSVKQKTKFLIDPHFVVHLSLL